MAYLEELLPEFRKGAKIRCKGWDENVYIEMKKGIGFVSNNRGRKYIFTYEDFNHACWEFYNEPKIDWDYIIKNKCLCWVWNNLGEIKFLKYLQAKEEHTFRDELGSCWDNCRPVRKDEIVFYEDRKDEHI